MKNSIEAGLPAKTADRRISRILLDCMKWLFSGYGKHKTTKKEPTQPLSFSHYIFTVLLIYHLTKPLYFSAKPYTIWRNYRLLPNFIGFCQIVWGFAKLFHFCQIVWGFAKRFHFRQIVSDFRQIVYTFWQNNPRTKVRTLPNVKLPLKTQRNNVNFRPKYCQECRIYGLCEVSATLSTEN